MVRHDEGESLESNFAMASDWTKEMFVIRFAKEVVAYLRRTTDVNGLLRLAPR